MSDRVYGTNFESFPCLVSHATLLFLKKDISVECQVPAFQTLQGVSLGGEQVRG